MKKLAVVIVLIGILICAALGLQQEMFDRMRRLAEFAVSLGIYPIYLLYLGTAKILPGVLVLSDTHAWYHNTLIVVVWIGIYIGALVGLRAYVRQQADLFIRRAWHNYEIHLFTGWQKWCSLLSMIGIVLIWYLTLPPLAFLVPCGCFLAVFIYDLKKAGLKVLFPLLGQMYLSLLLAVYFIIFSPVIFALYVIIVVLLVVGVTVKDTFSPKVVTLSYFDSEGRYLYSEKETR